MKRRLLASVSLAGLLAGCAALKSVTSSSTDTKPAIDATVSAVFNAIQFVLPLVQVLAVGIAAAVPSAAPIVAVVQPYIVSAGPVFQTLAVTMTQNEAKPIVEKIEGYLQGAVSAVAQAVNTPGADPRLAAFAPEVRQAQAVLAAVTAFVTGVQAMPTSAAALLPVWLHK